MIVLFYKIFNQHWCKSKYGLQHNFQAAQPNIWTISRIGDFILSVLILLEKA